MSDLDMLIFNLMRKVLHAYIFIQGVPIAGVLIFGEISIAIIKIIDIKIGKKVKG